MSEQATQQTMQIQGTQVTIPDLNSLGEAFQAIANRCVKLENDVAVLSMLLGLAVAANDRIGKKSTLSATLTAAIEAASNAGASSELLKSLATGLRVGSEPQDPDDDDKPVPMPENVLELFRKRAA